jgi:hypothetical protein
MTEISIKDLLDLAIKIKSEMDVYNQCMDVLQSGNIMYYNDTNAFVSSLTEKQHAFLKNVLPTIIKSGCDKLELESIMRIYGLSMSCMFKTVWCQKTRIKLPFDKEKNI